MAGNNDGDRIGAVCKTHGPAGFRVSDSPGQFSVRNRLAVRNFQEFLPDSLLEQGAVGRKLEMKTLELSGKVGAQLRAHFEQGSVVPLPPGLRLPGMTIAREADLGEPGFTRHQEKSSYWRRPMGINHRPLSVTAC